jgi:hypothetical protein
MAAATADPMSGRRAVVGAPGRVPEGRAAIGPLFLMEAAMRKHRDLEDLPCFRHHA